MNRLIEERGMSASEAKDVKSRLQWTVIDGVVYDITNYISMHPGGKKNILKGVGKDSTDMFHKSHPGLKIENTPLALLKMGTINSDSPPVEKKKETHLSLNFGVL